MTAVPIGGPYATRAQLKAHLGIPDSNTAQDDLLDSKLASSAMDINRWCHRQFGRDEVASTRTFRVGRTGLDVDDFWDATDLAIVPYLGTTAGTAWDVSLLQLEPLNGIVDQVPGWPYRRICGIYTGHPMMATLFYSATTAWVTTKWGWADCPANVTQANLLLAAADLKAKDAPFGVAGFGDYAVRIRSNPMAAEKLAPYVIDAVQVAS